MSKPDRAQRRLDQATEQVAEWKRREEELAAEVADAEANVGNAALESGDLEQAAARVANLRDQFGAARQTVAAAEAQRVVAQLDAWRAEATDLRAEGKKLDGEADKHSVRTRELLDALREHEGGDYEPSQPSPGLATDRKLWTPKTEQLRARAQNARTRADDLERQARRQESKQVPNSSSVSHIRTGDAG